MSGPVTKYRLEVPAHYMVEDPAGYWVSRDDYKAVEIDRDAAEDALLRKGYRKTCDIPACNCGDQWAHGGLAEERLREFADVLHNAVECNGLTLLAALHDLVRERDEARALYQQKADEWHKECLAADELRALLDEAQEQIARLRKIAAHVPAMEYIAAKERAGYGSQVQLQSRIPRGR